MWDKMVYINSCETLHSKRAERTILYTLEGLNSKQTANCFIAQKYHQDYNIKNYIPKGIYS